MTQAKWGGVLCLAGAVIFYALDRMYQPDYPSLALAGGLQKRKINLLRWGKLLAFLLIVTGSVLQLAE